MKKFFFLLLALMVMGGGILAGLRLSDEVTVWTFREQIGMMSARERASISVYQEGSPAPEAVRDVRQAAEEFNAFMENSLGSGLTQPVKLYVAGTEADYRKVLSREFGLPEEEAGKIASISGGWSGGSRRLTAINAGAGVMSGRSERISTTVHELFHQLQYELSEGHDTDEEAIFWLEEGTADYFGAAATEYLGGKSLKKWCLDVQMDVMLAENPVQPEELLHCSGPKRMELMGSSYHAYQVSDLLTCYLLERLPESERLVSVTGYFRALSEGKGGEAAFKKAFGLDIRTFLKEFHSWWDSFRRNPAQWHCTLEDGVTAERLALLESEVQRSQADLEAKLGAGHQLHGEYWLILTPDEDGLALAAQKYCDMEPGRSAMLSRNSLGIENGSTLLVNTEHLDDEQQRILSLHVLLMRSLEGQYLGRGDSVKDIAWLSKGTAYVFGIDAYLTEMGSRTLDYYHKIRQEHRKRAMPLLSGLRSEQDYNAAVEAYGAETVSNLSELAAFELLKEHGWNSFALWLSETRQLGDAEEAFRRVYGESSSGFTDRFQMQMLR